MNIKLKLSQNNQRRRLEAVQAKLPDSICKYLSNADFRYNEDVYSGHDLPFFPKGENGEYVYPDGYEKYEYTEVDQLLDLSKAVRARDLKYTKDCLVSLDRDAQFVVVEKSDMACFLESYLNEVSSRYIGLVVFQDDYRRGIVVDSYCGYLPKPQRTRYDEVVYEFVYWER